MLLLAWREEADRSEPFFTMVVDPNGNVCQPKRELSSEHGFVGDDFLLRPDGTISWANASGGTINVVTLTPG